MLGWLLRQLEFPQIAPCLEHVRAGEGGGVV